MDRHAGGVETLEDQGSLYEIQVLIRLLQKGGGSIWPLPNCFGSLLHGIGTVTDYRMW